MFMNLTARKPNGDFYITSTEVEQEKYPELDAYGLALHMQMLAGMMLTQGWTVELTREEQLEDPRQYAEDSADADAVYYGA